MTHRPLVLALAAVLAAVVLEPASASGGGGGGGGSGGGGMSTLAHPGTDPQVAAAVAAIQAGRYAEGAAQLESWLGRSEDNARDADAQNWAGYAYRKSGDLDAAFLHYDKALAIDPKHRGAHEYLGEAYLMAGNLARAEEHLAILDKLCWLPCAEYTQLKTAVASYRAGHPDLAGAR